ncbi:NAD(+) kinase [Thorsellia anophelis]|uniref:NAD kinase n=1 Tax=Thorsellia anophelis DSM 18579 TaxID=1123402 RepID=A0A1H9Z7I8_9GAMM|nr:NAD(+) kinase [Thorsellia anophelis]SES77516.1 NAD+ kinase [Thorsellia anophelis DSM 18579]
MLTTSTTYHQHHFGTIALIGHPRLAAALSTHRQLHDWLTVEGYDVLVEETLAPKLQLQAMKCASLDEIGKLADLAVVIGGDGNLLRAARILANYDINVIGVNRGNLGFLTDIDPDEAVTQLKRVLMGDYISENRFLLDVEIKIKSSKKNKNNQQIKSHKEDHEKTTSYRSNAINELVLHPRKIAHMIDFEVYIDDQFAFSHRADGLIIATPTGSTAYSLSAGGPILTPDLNALLLVPMFPHRLTARPLVVSGNSQIKLKFPNIKNKLEVNCDSQVALMVQPGDEVLVRKAEQMLKLIHPIGYSYFNTLSNKLNWAK